MAYAPQAASLTLSLSNSGKRCNQRTSGTAVPGPYRSTTSTAVYSCIYSIIYLLKIQRRRSGPSPGGASSTSLCCGVRLAAAFLQTRVQYRVYTNPIQIHHPCARAMPSPAVAAVLLLVAALLLLVAALLVVAAMLLLHCTFIMALCLSSIAVCE